MQLSFPKPTIDDILDRTRVVSLPMRVKFRGITVREAALIEGPAGWGEFSPFLEYGPQESSRWLASGLEAAFAGLPEPQSDFVEVNATIPAVDAAQVPELMARYPGCRTFKVKVAEPGQSLDDDLRRVNAVREVNPDAVIRVDANMGWTADQAIEAARRLGPIEYMEQPCRTVAELERVREYAPVAADESIRKAADPLQVKGRVDYGVVKVAPLGGVRNVLALEEKLGLPITVASALDTAVGLYSGVVAASYGSLAAGLATTTLFEQDVADVPIVDGKISTARVVPTRIDELEAAPDRVAWWQKRIATAYGYLL
ncbi:o-succinylbenzoate synthase [Corynebacterium renale]|uniref:o-succinylbenzoate synthase n=1 Tax=Corynebacterium renale TaxID=1724 RepID=UPI000E07C612|nr:o-succinylbenzoate synthase [Corynebacterium renale]STD03338.1 O-succinylbenzoate synthase [Corynebacterium renale]